VDRGQSPLMFYVLVVDFRVRYKCCVIIFLAASAVVFVKLLNKNIEKFVSRCKAWKVLIV